MIGALVVWGFCRLGLLSSGVFVVWGFCRLGFLSSGAFVVWGFCRWGFCHAFGSDTPGNASSHHRELQVTFVGYALAHAYGVHGHSCSRRDTSDAIVELLCDAGNCLENNFYVIFVFVDCSEAFDCVCYDVLARKLEHIDVRGSTLKRFASYYLID